MTLLRNQSTQYVMYCTMAFLFALLFTVCADSVFAVGEDDPLLHKVMLDRFEARDAEENTILALDSQSWIGGDLQKLWFKVEAERAGAETEDIEVQALYSQAILPYWDIQVGLRKDFRPTPSRSWVVFGFQGLAPYFFEVDAALFVGESGRTALRLEAGYELLFTQKLILSPNIDVNFYGRNDADTGAGSGLSDIETGLRLRYEIRRELAPYIGVNWNKRFGNTADFVRNERGKTSDLQWVIGIKVWF